MYLIINYILYKLNLRQTQKIFVPLIVGVPHQPACSIDSRQRQLIHLAKKPFKLCYYLVL